MSLHCWQGDDVGGFEERPAGLDGGMAVTGRYPGRARSPADLRADLEQALALIPGRHRVNLHAMYGEFGGPEGGSRRTLSRNISAIGSLGRTTNWLGLDFNPTCFAHPKAADGLTLAHPDPAIRQFWIEHCIACRRIGFDVGNRLKNPCVTNLWVPDGFKDTPADRLRGPRKERLAESLDRIFQQDFPERALLDAVESKLFGIGVESCTVGSRTEFYLGYAITRKKASVPRFRALPSHRDDQRQDLGGDALCPRSLLLHVSRGVRWDSDHVVTLTDDLLGIAREIVANGYLDRVHLGLDYFDASINRVAAWVIGARNLLRALLMALLEPPGIRAAEAAGDPTARLALQEEAKGLPFGAVWDHYCESKGVPVGEAWLAEVRTYEKEECWEGADRFAGAVNEHRGRYH